MPQPMEPDPAALAVDHPEERTVFAVLLSISFCHLLNDLVQSLLPAIYPMLKTGFHLNFAQVGLITLAFQLTASLLQPLVGLYADRRPQPFSLSIGMALSLAGLGLLSVAWNFPMLLGGAALVGMGSSVFHPESSRVARMASGGQHGLAQSLFQVGGNAGSAMGPLLAAFVVLPRGQSSIGWFSIAALLGMVILYNVGIWYKHHGLAHVARHHKKAMDNRPDLSRRQVWSSLGILLALMFSKHFYLVSIGSYFTFYLIETFHVSVRSAQLHLFVFLGAAAVGTIIGGPIGDRFGRKHVIWASILGVLPFSMALPYANLFWTSILSAIIGLVLASAFPAIVVYGQELVPGKIGMIAGLFFGFAFGVAGVGAAVLGELADRTSITFVYHVCSFLPAIGLLAAFLPHIERPAAAKRAPA